MNILTRMGPGQPRESAPSSLLEAVQQVADCPCSEYQTAFLAALSKCGELLFRAVDVGTPPVERPHQVGSDERIQLEQVTFQGQTFLLAFPDIVTARQSDPQATIVGIPCEEALQMTLQAQLDGILIAGTSGAWAAATTEAIAELLTS